MEHVKFQDWALTWVGEKRNFVKESTYANYVIGIRNHLIPQIGEYVIEGVTREVETGDIWNLACIGSIIWIFLTEMGWSRRGDVWN